MAMLKKVVIKIGGHELENAEFLRAFAQRVAALPVPPVIVHGGGKAISQQLADQGIEAIFYDGQRVTDDATMTVVEQVLCGTANKSIVRALQAAGAHALGLCGSDLALLRCEPLAPELGRVGRPTSVNCGFLRTLLEANIIPVIAPVGLGDDYRAYNINADLAAAAIANALPADELFFLSNINGVEIGGTTVETLSFQEFQDGMRSGDIRGGMIPKLQSAFAAAAQGVGRVRIGNLAHISSGGTRIFHENATRTPTFLRENAHAP